MNPMSAELSRLVAESGQFGIAVEKVLSPDEGMTGGVKWKSIE
jgi:hypothetical protein